MGSITAPLRWAFVLIGVFSLFLNMLVLAVPLYMLQIYDRVLVSRSNDTLLMITIIAVGALALFGLLEAVRGTMANRAAARFEISAAQPVFERVIRDQRPERFGPEPMRDVAIIRGFAGSRVALGLLDLPFAPVFIAVVFLIHPLLGYVTLFGALLLLGLAATNDRLTIAPQRDAVRSVQEGSLRAQSIIRNADSVKAMGMLSPALANWAASQARALISMDRVGVRNASFFALTRFFRLLLQIAILGLGAYLVLRNELTAGMIFASSLVSARALGPIEQAVGGWKTFSQARLANRRLKQLFATTKASEDRTALPPPKGRVEVDRLVYMPPESAIREPILKAITFSLEAGEVLGIVGPTGAGKSTLARQLVGAASPTSGHVRLDGADIVAWPDESRFKYIGYLPQTIELLPGTVAENIARFDPERRDADVVDAAKLAEAHDLVTQLPDAYETRIGPGGQPLSGGQTQRIALARALYGPPTLAVLDEPNAHLDAEAERRQMEMVAGARERGMTMVIVTQRRLILQAVDRILYLKDGRAEIGPRDEMLIKLGLGRPSQAAPEQETGARIVSARLQPVRTVAHELPPR